MKLSKYIHFYAIVILVVSALLATTTTLVAQQQADSGKVNITFDPANPREFVIADITISGVKYLNPEQILSFIGVAKGDTVKIPNEDISLALKRLWAQRHFSDIVVSATKIEGDKIYLDIQLTERPRVSAWNFKGAKKGERDDLREKLHLRRGSEVSDYLLKVSTDAIKSFYAEKGYRKAEVNIIQEADTLVPNAVKVTFDIKKNSKVKIKRIYFEGNEKIKDRKLRKSMKKTKDMRLRNLFSSKKFNDEEYPNDKESLIRYYNEKGYRDAAIVSDSIYYINDKRLGIKITVDEGRRYYFRDITWVGNTIIPSVVLSSILGIKRGDVYDVVAMEKMLQTDQASVSTQYMDQGYLFFNVHPVEVNIVGDSIDIEMRIFEGKQATFNRINITGNTKTNEHVIRRELWTRPGYLFSKSDFERSLRELAQSNNFDAEKLMSAEGYKLVPNERDGTADVTFNVEEKSNDQIELSGGYGGNTFIATVGLKFSNFSIGRMFKKGAWRPVPSGDGQTLALRFQTNGSYYTATSISFVEPWLGGKKPTSLSLSAYYTRETDGYYFQSVTQSLETYGLSVGIGQRLKWPDSYFTLYTGISLQHYVLSNWRSYFLFSDGQSNNFSFNIIFGRNSTDQPIYPRKGSDFSLGLQLTLPYSLFTNKDYKTISDSERYKWIEYHKWTFKGALYTQLIGDFVLMTRAQFGFLAYYNSDWGYSPFEAFILGGDGMSGFNRYGQENIALRGYVNSSVTPVVNGAYAGHIYDKFTVELRHPVIMQPQAQIFAYVFFEGGNAWSAFDKFNPFAIKRSAGIGVRLMLPIVGTLGIDWGYGFDNVPHYPNAGGGQIHFTFGMPM
ncbi:MAG: outer membrane protein assembly factor BamA [Prevotellaceae bacterium]|jgi:outer membrane protein insertion porin family|nr:outer membrane protein assembly factor BamA [Prevotellaceae bacterium]